MDNRATWLDDTTLRVMTYRSGAFTFQVGVDLTVVQPLIDRINDAQHRFNKTPLLPTIVDQMRERVTASSVYGTNTIEGGTFTEEETRQILRLDPKDVQAREAKRLTNLKQAIEWVQQHNKKALAPYQGQPINPHSIQHLHTLVSQGVDEANNPTGQFRNNQKGQKTLVGNALHGGVYRPPKCLDDILLLMQAWIDWLNHPNILSLPVLIRAPLAHYYFELIHPFWDGNGRTGRLIEMLILEQSGYRFSSAEIWRFYQQHLHQYFSLFNVCRQSAQAKAPFSNQVFIEFFLDGMFSTINKLHDDCNFLVEILLLKDMIRQATADQRITPRQAKFLNTLMLMGWQKLSPSALYRHADIQIIYADVTERTFYRDIQKMIGQGFLVQTEQGEVGLASLDF